MSRKPHSPDDISRSKVETLAAVGVRHEDIARIIKIDPTTLRIRYRDELDLGTAKANAQIAQRLYQRAVDGDLGAMIFWLKARAGWREKHTVEHMNPDGSPIQQAAGVVIVQLPPNGR